MLFYVLGISNVYSDCLCVQKSQHDLLAQFAFCPTQQQQQQQQHNTSDSAMCGDDAVVVNNNNNAHFVRLVRSL